MNSYLSICPLQNVTLKRIILTFLTACLSLSQLAWHAVPAPVIQFDFYGEPISFVWDERSQVGFNADLSKTSVITFSREIEQKDHSGLIKSLGQYHAKHHPDDWLFYQLIRKTAQQISPKASNYIRYTLYKWYLLQQLGYDAILTVSPSHILLYVQSDEHIYNIPSRLTRGKQYVCLNFHDYPGLDLEKEKLEEVPIPSPPAAKGFSYKVTQLPQFASNTYEEKDIRFRYYQSEYQFTLRLNPQVKNIFANYPVVDYEYYFNIPMSKETYGSLIPALQKNIEGMSMRNGIDYLMRFTRYAFLYKPDIEVFGNEKRLSPEQTLLYDQSDCDDRAALFFFLVKELYDIPMLVLVYPHHVTIAVQLDKPVGKPIVYNGKKYSICEPTPQKEDLPMGQILPSIRKENFDIAYAYQPQHSN